MEASWNGISDVLREEGQEALELVEETAKKADVPLQTRLIDGSPRRAIVEYADGHDCDLIVMGTHGRGGINRLLMGSVTEGVIRTSDRPVLTVQLGDRSDGDEQQDDTATES